MKTQRYVVLLILWAIPIVFKKLLEGFLDKYWIEPIASQFEQLAFADIVVIVILGFAIIHFIYSKWIKVHLDWQGLLLAFLFCSYLFFWIGFDKMKSKTIRGTSVGTAVET